MTEKHGGTSGSFKVSLPVGASWQSERDFLSV